MTVTTTAPAPQRPVTRLKLANDVKRTDFVLVGAALLLSIIGAALIFSATRGKLIAADQDPRLFLDKQMINIVIGIILGWAVSSVGYRTLRASAWWVYGAALLLLLLVLTPAGTTLNGIQAWITLPAGFSLQPSELAKVAVILAVALVLTQLGPSGAADADVRPRLRYVLLALIIAGVPVLLIMMQPDLGTALVIVATVFGMLAVSGVSSYVLWGMVALAGLAAYGVVQLGMLDEYQIDRLLIFMDPEADPLGAGYNTRMARLAIAGGGVFGYGLFNGPTTQGGFVPYQQTDFIFSAAGEELGLIGAGVIILLVGVILWRGVRIALAAPDRYGRVMAAGVVIWLAVQSFENIGMNLGIMPVTGVPLPFVSYGGSSMFALWIGVGLLTSVHLRSVRQR
ncbi:MAG: rod shape-determining protein RodA [Actinobacteria bacterium]|nr:rod shape-determining protein RodA [Actinomycetota bacterium]MCB9413245.1 rod shape-determining protein RodA [Actinomycetota bacterium]